ncbi:YgiW/YdeI family stress tolerance OB fold protein [Pasteurella sp. PK-2025]|uniref:YgiW/YdeI family stress tolerance OB fold protein n=1 Tax=unclassified Pasteurella TaxID=2621516 RepID=UPI003C76220E
MKKLMTFASLLAISGMAVAQGGFKNTQNTQAGGGYGPNSAVTTVKAALNAKDDTYVSIEGHIVSQIDGDEFIFRDVAGSEIRIDVSDRAWNGQTIQPYDRIVIQGTVDKEWNKTDIDVKNIIKK